MKILSVATALALLFITLVTALSIPPAARDASLSADSSSLLDLVKRRGGGGGGGRSGGGSGGRSGSGGSSSSSSSSSSGRTGNSGSSGSSSRTSSSSNVGGTSRSGSGTRPTYGGGYYYAGGATAPYTSGAKSRLGVTPYLLPAAIVPLYFPGLWLYGAYVYPYSYHYHYMNDTSHKNESLPVNCICQQYLECGCDENSNSTYYESLFNGTQPRNTSVAKVVDVNGTESIYINGTLANGTTAADSAATHFGVHGSGYWIMVAVVVGIVWT
ncbi:hypothetical protein M752DRAFT_18919 [Aspergillus phoenicis ATCC 13157]|uniref:DUF7732 domain-containing protein n=1 Tax=Aspergillus phoenicis ATCC 13157 TaxID=1353007 RepID=A0A370PK90_ASPPH|nr:hypothetical protein M752DRAFT_18919 [Aspergillus phoenicis ATCC 13157]